MTKEQEIHAKRCAEEGHTEESGITILFEFVLVCKWCGNRRYLHG